MHYAVDFSFDACLGLLIQANAALDIPDHSGDTALHLAASSGRQEVFAAVLVGKLMLKMRMKMKWCKDEFIKCNC